MFVRSFFIVNTRKSKAQSNASDAKGTYFGTVYSPQDWSSAEALTEGKRLLVVKYSADYCRPCHLIAPEYQALCNCFNCVFCDLDVNNTRIAHLCEGVYLVPTFAVFSCESLPPKKLIKFEGADLDPLKEFLGRYSNAPYRS